MRLQCNVDVYSFDILQYFSAECTSTPINDYVLCAYLSVAGKARYKYFFSSSLAVLNDQIFNDCLRLCDGKARGCKC